MPNAFPAEFRRDEVAAAIAVADEVRRELDDDDVGLWKIPRLIRRELPHATDDAVRDLAEAIVGGLIGLGAVLGDLDGESGVFVAWPTSGALETAMSAWRALGHDPRMGDIGWLALSPHETLAPTNHFRRPATGQ